MLLRGISHLPHLTRHLVAVATVAVAVAALHEGVFPHELSLSGLFPPFGIIFLCFSCLLLKIPFSNESTHSGMRPNHPLAQRMRAALLHIAHMFHSHRWSAWPSRTKDVVGVIRDDEE